MKNKLAFLGILAIALMGCGGKEEDKEQEIPVEKIKSDLIGNSIPVWNFDYLSEFQDFKILKTIIADNRAECDASVVLLDEQTNKTLNCVIRVMYEKTYSVWSFQRVMLQRIVYENTAPTNGWQKVNPINNCSFVLEKTDKKFTLWNPCNGKKFNLGGSEGVHLDQSAYCDSLYIQSQEKEPIKVSFVYRQYIQRD